MIREVFAGARLGERLESRIQHFGREMLCYGIDRESYERQQEVSPRVSLEALNEALKALNDPLNGLNAPLAGFNGPLNDWNEPFKTFSGRPSPPRRR